MKMNNKGQSALEYLMTYGWALVVIVVVVAVLYALGVFNIGGSLETCTGFPAGVATYDSHLYKATDGNFQLRFTNGPKEITINSMKVGTGVASTTPIALLAGEKKTLSSIGVIGTAGSAYNTDLVLGYDVTGGLTGLTATLKCTGKYQ